MRLVTPSPGFDSYASCSPADRTTPDHIMWKSFFIAAGIFACLLGLELLIVDSAVVLPLNGHGTSQVFMAPDWAPWTLISAGAITLLNFGSLPLKSAGSGMPRPH